MKTNRPLTKLTAIILSLAMILTLLIGAAPLPEQQGADCTRGDGLCAFDEGADCRFDSDNEDESYTHTKVVCYQHIGRRFHTM